MIKPKLANVRRYLCIGLEMLVPVILMVGCDLPGHEGSPDQSALCVAQDLGGGDADDDGAEIEIADEPGSAGMTRTPGER